MTVGFVTVGLMTVGLMAVLNFTVRHSSYHHYCNHTNVRMSENILSDFNMVLVTVVGVVAVGL